MRRCLRRQIGKLGCKTATNLLIGSLTNGTLGKTKAVNFLDTSYEKSKVCEKFVLIKIYSKKA